MEELKEPKVHGGIICLPRIISGWHALSFQIWVEAYRSARPDNECLYKRLKRDIFNNRRFTNIKELAASQEYAKWLVDYLFIEIEFRKALAPYDPDEDSAAESLWYIQSAYDSLLKP